MTAPAAETFADLPTLAEHLRDVLQDKRFILLYGYNGTGKTRLSGAFKDLGKDPDDDSKRDTLYFNAFTEDLFSWDNDLENDTTRALRINVESSFIAALPKLEMDTRIRQLLDRYADFDFRIETEVDDRGNLTKAEVRFFQTRDLTDEKQADPIKVSRGEENIFIWCFFLAVLQLALDGAEAYRWVKYVYIDDPISSLDEQNAVLVATHLSSMLKDGDNKLRTVISTHHPLFFNVLYNELSRTKGNRFFFLRQASDGVPYSLLDTGDTPFFHHVACLMELHEAARTGRVFTHHFNMLRVIAEKTASFLGYDKFADCIKRGDDDPDGILHNRLLNLLSHGKYSLYEPTEMLPENREHFRRMLGEFTERFVFNPERFPPLGEDEQLQPATTNAAESDTMTAEAT